MIKPRKLSQGNTLGIIAPASPTDDIRKIEGGIKVLNEMGFKVLLGASCKSSYGYLAGKDDVRVKDINNFFTNSSVDGIICLRGGYGTIRLLDLIDYTAIRRNPKVFIGYSDITALHCAFHKKCDLVTFHGPMITSDLVMKNYTEINGLLAAVNGKIKNNMCNLIPLIPGNFIGQLIGGNLSVLCALIGSEYEEDFNNKILFIEDINEEPYRIDRMLHQLKHRGIFRRVKGVILGQFTDCESSEPEKSFSLEYLFKDFFSSFQIPIYAGLKAGHGKEKLTLPLGANVQIKNNILYFTEEGVIK